MTFKNEIQVTIIIKALNEEKNIKRAIESALLAVSLLENGEVILADSLSTDQTVKIASDYPIKIVQLIDKNDRCCGVGAQLGYQISQGKYVYILDGDMEIEQDFLPKAIDYLEKNPNVAGVGGLVQEMCLESLEFQRRVKNSHVHKKIGKVDRLDMGGLYRKSAVEQVGYLTNRNLHSYEEFELAARLQTNGWFLERINIPAVKHYGHTTEAFTLMLKRWKSRYSWGIGELLASSLGKKHFGFVLLHVKQIYLYAAVVFWWILLVASSIMLSMNTVVTLLVVKCAVLILMMFKKKSIQNGLYSIFSWNLNAMSLVAGIMLHFTKSQEVQVNYKQVK